MATTRNQPRRQKITPIFVKLAPLFTIIVLHRLLFSPGKGNVEANAAL